MNHQQQQPPEIVGTILDNALASGASDVYWLPQEDGVLVRRRVAGTQEDVTTLAGETGQQCLTHLKVLAGLLTYRTAVAQDGTIRRREGGTEMRVASMPTIFGERITVRMMSNAETPDYIEELGFDADVQAGLRRLLSHPCGMIVLTGPTGCGKSTTIYALIRELLREHQDPTSIITLEDPIEKVIGNISQVNVAAGKDEWTYEIALRAALRQDVKTLVVGEMRDRGVVQVVLDAALTGHRVITTYHAGDIPSVYARMLHQGFEPFLIAAAVTGVVTQRLIPGVDDKLVPAAALLEPDDAWREFVCTRPGLGQLRAHVADRPQADIRRRITALADQGRISEEQKSLLTEG